MQDESSSRSKPDPALVAILKRFRHRNGLTQEDLAFKSNVTISTLSRIERGATDPAWSSIRAITRALGMGLDELGAAIELEEQPLPPAEA
jgi:transcriptional regulator with XRE-family HTH domain